MTPLESAYKKLEAYAREWHARPIPGSAFIMALTPEEAEAFHKAHPYGLELKRE